MQESFSQTGMKEEQTAVPDSEETATDGQSVWLKWLAEVMQNRPKGNMFLDSPRGIEVARLCLAYEKQDFAWHRGDEDTFWVDVQLFVKYGLSDDEILFTLKQQPGVENYRKHAAERNAYAEFMRGLQKLRNIEFKKQRENG